MTALLVALAPIGIVEAASTIEVLTHFDNTTGANPRGAVVLGRGGSLYGTTYAGGTGGMGVVFKLTPPVPGQTVWTHSVILNFQGTANGANPEAGLIIDKRGALYGTTLYGGSSGWAGSVFKLTPPTQPTASWTHKELFPFAGNGLYGSYPHAGVVFGADGALYGTNDARMYQLTPSLPGQTETWTPTILFKRTEGRYGYPPLSDLVMGASGELYGTTFMGGYYGGNCQNSGCGMVYKLTPPATPDLAWTQTVLYAFEGSKDGYYPQGGVTLGPDGALYGTTQSGGGNNLGTLFRLTPPPFGKTRWTKSVLSHFPSKTNTGTAPMGRLVFGPDLALYGTTYRGGASTSNGGTVFKLEPPGKCTSTWTASVIADLDYVTGINPRSGVIVGPDGALYGTTENGGTYGYGTVFRITP